MKIGIAGTGRMGVAIGARLLDQGHELHVWNRSAARTKPLTDTGAKLAATPAELAARCEALITILTDSAAIDAVYQGRDGLLSGNVAGKLFIEMSTVPAATQCALAPAVAAKGAAVVECPVGGSVGPAREGKLIGFIGGSAADAARARPIVEQLCRRVEHVGPTGAGAAMKLAINLPLAVYWQAFGEALSLVQGLGIEPDRLVSIFADTSAGPNMLKPMGPGIVQALKGDLTGTVMFDVDSVRKDLRTMLEEARAQGKPLPIVTRALEVFNEASGEGWGPRNCSTLPAYWLARGTKFREH
ncbi:MAG TPA: NAD(P)-dependent oxidoreductase [Burkholderiales bacterium]|nr:NAD(P)-dependent oxidoreductase [Burkholderiales bacterium]